MTDNRQYAALEWVVDEIKQTLTQARQALEAYVEDPQDATQLRFCLTYIHQVYGSLHMVEFHGAAMLAEEMEALAKAYSEKQVTNSAEAQDVLMRSILQLPAYLEQVQQTKQDSPTIVLPLLNDLRAVRGANLLSESNLFSPDLGPAYRVYGSRYPLTQDAAQFKTVVTKLRKMYQYAAASVIHQLKVDENLAYLNKVFQRLHKILQGTHRSVVWGIAAALVDGLQAGIIEPSAAVKNLLRHLDQELKQLLQGGLTTLNQSTNDELLKNLLYYIACTNGETDSMAAIKKTYSLQSSIHIGPSDNNHDTLGITDISALRSVSTAIKGELNDTKEKLDACLGNDEPAQHLSDIQQTLQRVNDTLAVLGVGPLRQKVDAQVKLIKEIQTQNAPVSTEQLLHIAGNIVEVESGLEFALGAEQKNTASSDYHFDKAQISVLQESRNGLEKTKDSIVEYIATQWNVDRLKKVPGLLREIRGGLIMLPLERPAVILEACASYIERELIRQQISPEWRQLDSLADAIASVDYYLERMLDSQDDDTEALLDVAEESLSALGYSVKAFAPFVSGAEQPTLDETPYSESVQPEPSPTASVENIADNVVAKGESENASLSIESAVAADENDSSDDEIDEEILEIFVEEATEVREAISTYFPKWADDFTDNDSLLEFRRAFHTLKGSGRMVHADDIGELAWSIENMLNRIIDKTIEPGQLHTTLIARVNDILPEMISAFEHQKPNSQKDKSIQYMAWAHELAKGDASLELTRGLSTSKEAEVVADEEVDLQLLEIFRSESLTHLTTVNEYIDTMDAAAPLYEPPSDPMQRALHTLKGSAYMAEVMCIAELAAPLEGFAKELRSYQVNIDDDMLQLFKDGVSYVSDALDQIADGNAPSVPKLVLYQARIAELRERSVGPLIRQQEAEIAQKQVDPALLEIFMAEEMDLLLDVEPIINNWKEHGASASDWQPLIDELDTLSNGADKANLPAMAELSKALQACYSSLSSGRVQADSQYYDNLVEGHNSLLDMIDSIAAGQNLPARDDDLMSRLQMMSEALDHELPVSEIPALNNSANNDRPSETTAAIDPLMAAEISAGKFSSATEGLDATDAPSAAIAVPLTPGVDESSVVDNTSAEDVVEEGIAELEDELLPLADVEDEEVDEEIIEIFVDEADELLEDIDEAVHEWEDDWSHSASNESLQRSLHTLKGGARLAGLVHLGDLAHNFETFLIDLSQQELSESAFQQIHRYQDQLIKNVAAVKAGIYQPVDDAITGADEPVEDGQDTTDIELNTPAISDETNSSTDTTASIEQPIVEDSPASISVVHSSDTVTRLKPVKVEDNVLPFMPKPAVTDVSAPIMPEAPSGAAASNKTAARRAAPQEVVKVSADLMEELVNLAGETSISRGRMEEQISDLSFSLDEMGSTVQRLQEQLRRLDIETEAQVLFRQEQMAAELGDFDPLEMDRYSHLQQLSRSLIESASDLMDLKATLADKTRDAETVLLQQSRINTDLQEGLMRSRMVPFSRMVPRLRRIIRQISSELGKTVSFEFDNVEGELDRTMLERMVAPLEHMLRNAVDHGIEDAEQRIKAGKSPTGRIVLSLGREGGDVLIRLADDGQGIDLQRVREKAIERNLMNSDAQLSDQEVLQFILHAGFSTADTVTQISGRGVGMDVVHSEIKQLGGSMAIDSRAGEGTAFTMRLPFTVSVNRALMVLIGEDRYAIPLNTIEGIVRISPYELEHYYNNPESRFEYAGELYQVRYLGGLLNSEARPKLEGQILPIPVLLLRTADHAVALQVDHLQGSREIVVKSLGAQFSTVQGLSGATIMGDGHVVVILDLNAIIRRAVALSEDATRLLEITPRPAALANNPLVMVVDDSVTVRKVTTRLLEREGYDVITAKDGVDAMNMLQDHSPDIMLLDIEMPRMDGFEVAKNIRSNNRLQSLPIIMITSRTGEKHRQRGLDLGVNAYMGKPYQEDKLLQNIRELMEAASTVDH